MTLLRAMDPTYSTDADILRAFYPTETVKLSPANKARLHGDAEAEIPARSPTTT